MSLTIQTPEVYILKMSTGKAIASPRPPTFRKEHLATYMSLGSLKSREVKEPAKIVLYNNAFLVNAIDDAKPHTSGTEALRMNDKDSAAYRAMEARHAEIQRQLKAEQLDFLADAAKRARRVRVSDCTNASDAR